jgi:hypothetical protein
MVPHPRVQFHSLATNMIAIRHTLNLLACVESLTFEHER